MHVSACSSNTSGPQIQVGTSADPNGYITAFTGGVSGVPVEKEAITDFDGALAASQFPDIADGAVINVVVDHDYNGGGSAADCADLTIVLTFVEG